MDWTAAVDNYCERLEPGLWAEPWNAVTNLAFILGALWLWPQVKGDRGAQALTISLFSIGLASGLFHTHAQSWTRAADSISILIFILIYLYLATSRMLHLSKLWSYASIPLFFPFAAVTAYVVVNLVGPLNGSVAYLPVLFLIAGFAIATRRKPAISRGLWIGVGLLAASLIFRSIDHAFCPNFPTGTHLFWHILNAIMLTHMTRLMTRHAPPLASKQSGG